jgi:hypothetical protein
LISRQLSEVAKQSNAERPELLREGASPKAMKDGLSLGHLTKGARLINEAGDLAPPNIHRNSLVIHLPK